MASLLAVSDAGTLLRFAFLVCLIAICAVVVIVTLGRRQARNSENTLEGIRLSVAGHQILVMQLLTQAKEEMMEALEKNNAIHKDILAYMQINHPEEFENVNETTEIVSSDETSNFT